MVKTSEWDARSIIAYAQIHHQDKFKRELIKIEKWSDNKIDKYIISRGFSLNSKNLGNLVGKNRLFKNALISANIVNNNNPDITKVTGEELEGIDLLTYSFPCQGLSIANMGRGKGIKKDSESTSNLIWEIYRILIDAIKKNVLLPKYLIMENVRNLLSSKHIADYELWLGILKKIGYKTNTMILNGLNHNSLQSRERVFAISVLEKTENNKINKNFKEDLLVEAEKFRIMFEKKFSNKLSIEQREIKYKQILASSNRYIDEIICAIPNNTPSRIKMGQQNHDLLNRKWQKNKEFTFNTLTTKQDRHPNIGMIKVDKKIKGKLDKRFITPREAYQIMGFTSKDFSKVKKMYKLGVMTKESLYRQAGNSIVVTVLEDIFKYIANLERKENE